MEIALYKNIKYNYVLVSKYPADAYANDPLMLRCSEVIDVDFVMLDESEMIQSDIDLLKIEIENEQQESRFKVNNLKKKLEELTQIKDESK